MLLAADIILHLLHVLILALNLFGWMWARTRRLSLISLTLTLGGWFCLGYFYGYGHFPLTNLHWRVKAALGEHDLPKTYLAWLTHHLIGWQPDPAFMDGIIVGSLCPLFAAALYVNLTSLRRTPKPARPAASPAPPQR